MRLPYAPTAPTTNEPSTQAIYARIAARRSPHPLLPLDLALLHSPNVADGWNNFLGAIRTRTRLSDDIREIAICRVAALNGAAFEWEHHAPLARQGGVDDQGMDILAKGEAYTTEVGEGLDARQWVVVIYTDAMSRNIRVSDEVFEALRREFSPQEVVEITATVAAYNCVSRFLVALDGM